jgi:hypothetical protein
MAKKQPRRGGGPVGVAVTLFILVNLFLFSATLAATGSETGKWWTIGLGLFLGLPLALRLWRSVFRELSNEVSRTVRKTLNPDNLPRR